MAQCPNAVVWRISAIVTLAVNAVSWRRSWSHVFIKTFKRSKPSFTNGDTTTSVSGVVTSLRVVATLFHIVPSVTFWQQRIRRATTATSCWFSFSIERASGDYSKRTTTTQAYSPCFSFVPKGDTQGCQVAENRTRRCVKMLSTRHDLPLV